MNPTSLTILIALPVTFTFICWWSGKSLDAQYRRDKLTEYGLTDSAEYRQHNRWWLKTPRHWFDGQPERPLPAWKSNPTAHDTTIREAR